MSGHPSWIPRTPGAARPEGAATLPSGAIGSPGDPHGGFARQYASGHAPWDIGEPQPEIVALEEEGVFGHRVLDVGCGTGETAVFLASRGHDVVGVDAVPEAIEAAKAKATEAGLDICFRAADVLEVLPELIGKFHSVADVGFFHSLSIEERSDFAKKLAGKIAPGGVYVMLCFSEREPGSWGPKRVCEEEIRTAFSGPEWHVREVRAAGLHSAVATLPVVDANLALVQRL
jgi:2-polyprenyl-3-methyl-5-hydroxy-6-metoxy-1,4-benzoquinol methylase